jgi:cytosine/adenosine deaminase-related metal-dependent hydrolase
MKILTADYVLPISSPPIENGAVAIDGSLIKDVGPTETILGSYPDSSVENFGLAAILPGFVNCHSHLEVTAMRGSLDSVEHDFAAWLLTLNEIRKGFSDEDICISALAGAAEGAAAGVTSFGDIGRYGRAGLEALKVVGLRGILYQETDFYVEGRTAVDDVKRLVEKFEDLRSGDTGLVEVGISPHSPYTVGPRQLELIAEFAVANKVKLTIHAAESRDERDLIETGSGFFTGIYEKFGVQWESPHCSTIEYLERTGVLSAGPLLAHCVTVDGDDIDLIAASGSAIAHCPKSNAKFGHGYAPFEAMLDAGIPIGLGSDSVASNNMCDHLEEMRSAVLAARNRPDSHRMLTAEEGLEAATLGGAKALGLGDVTGSLERGKRADIAVVSLTHLAQSPVVDVQAALVFSTCARDVIRTIVDGEDVYSNGKVLRCDEDEVKRGLDRMIRQA